MKIWKLLWINVMNMLMLERVHVQIGNDSTHWKWLYNIGFIIILTDQMKSRNEYRKEDLILDH